MEMYKLELYHHGVPNMKWGQRRYQNKDGSLTALGRLRYRRAQKAYAKAEKNLAKAKKLGIEKPELDEDQKMSVEAKKQKVLASRSAKELYDNAPLFDDKELDAAYKRLSLERNIKSLIPENKKKGEEFVKNAATWSKNVTDFATNATSLYNKVALARNYHIADGDDWPIIGAKSKRDIEEKKKKKES